MKKGHKIIFFFVIVMGVPFLFVVSTLSSGAQTCANYYKTECKLYNFISEECNCNGELLHLNQTMVDEKNFWIKEQNKQREFYLRPLTEILNISKFGLINESN